MPTRPDLRDIAHNVRDALADCDRDALLDILTFVIKEYVVEGPPPMLIHQTETIADLERLSFAQLVTALQTRLEQPELALFAVDGEQVSVRVGGAMHPLLPSRSAPVAAELPRPAAGVRVVETTVAQRPPAPAERGAPRPAQGISLRGRPTGGGMAPEGAEAAPPAPAAPSQPPATGAAPAGTPGGAAPPAKEGGEGTPDGDDAAARFSLLELD